MCGLAGHGEVGDDLDLGPLIETRHVGGDGRIGGAASPGLTALGIDDGPVGGVIHFNERRFAFVGDLHWTDLDLDASGEVFAIDRVDGRAGHAGCNPFDVAEHCPCGLNINRHGESVGQFHMVRSLQSVSAGHSFRDLLSVPGDVSVPFGGPPACRYRRHPRYHRLRRV